MSRVTWFSPAFEWAGLQPRCCRAFLTIFMPAAPHSLFTRAQLECGSSLPLSSPASLLGGLEFLHFRREDFHLERTHAPVILSPHLGRRTPGVRSSRCAANNGQGPSARHPDAAPSFPAERSFGVRAARCRFFTSPLAGSELRSWHGRAARICATPASGSREGSDSELHALQSSLRMPMGKRLSAPIFPQPVKPRATMIRCILHN